MKNWFFSKQEPRRQVVRIVFWYIFLFSIFLAISLRPGEPLLTGALFCDSYVVELREVSAAAAKHGILPGEVLSSRDQPLETLIAMDLTPEAGYNETVVVPKTVKCDGTEVETSHRTTVTIVLPQADFDRVNFWLHVAFAVVFMFFGVRLLWFTRQHMAILLGLACLTLPSTFFHPIFPAFPMLWRPVLYALHGLTICVFWLLLYLYTEGVAFGTKPYSRQKQLTKSLFRWAFFIVLVCEAAFDLFATIEPILTRRFNVTDVFLIATIRGDLLPWAVSGAMLGPALYVLFTLSRNDWKSHLQEFLLLAAPAFIYNVGLLARWEFHVFGNDLSYLQLATYPAMLICLVLATRSKRIRSEVTKAGMASLVAFLFVPIALAVDIGLRQIVDSWLALTLGAIVGLAITSLIQRLFDRFGSRMLSWL